MAIQMGKVLAFTAVGGLVAGLAGCGPEKPASNPGSGEGATSAPAAGAKECCKGKNTCKGKGGCKTDANTCQGKNDCKGKGGCKTGQCE
jgi:hypothetical protein